MLKNLKGIFSLNTKRRHAIGQLCHTLSAASVVALGYFLFFGKGISLLGGLSLLVAAIVLFAYGLTWFRDEE